MNYRRTRTSFVAVPIEKRFWKHVRKTSHCWVWTANTDISGYGIVKNLGKNRKAHRISWEMANGPIPDGYYICHRCDNRPCVRPDHLFVGTSKDNKQDAVKKGRHARGERITIANMTPKTVREARTRFDAGGCSYGQLSRDYGVTHRTIMLLITRQTWRHV